MTGDGTSTGKWWRKPLSGSASPKKPPAPDEAARRDDEIFKQSMAELSRRLGERAARQAAADPAAAAAARRAALEEYDRARERRMIWGLSVAVVAGIAAGVAYLLPPFGTRPVPLPSSAATRPEPAPPIAQATAAPAPAPPEPASPSPAPSSPSQAASVASPPPVTAAATEPAPAAESQPAPVEPAPNQVPLRRDDVREVQARLRSFGFNPGPADGTAGRMTATAVMHYQQDRGQPQTGTVDRELLEQLRQDPAPQVVQQVAQRATRPAPRGATGSSAARRSDPFEPVRAAADRFGQWLGSLTR
jgi:hypothetical protein